MTKINLIAFLFFTFLLTLGVNAQKAEIDKNALAQVKRIYIEDEVSALPAAKRLSSYLRTELTKQGFVAADTKEDADAVLSSEISAQVTLDGDGGNPPDKAIYYCRLLSLSGKLYWKETVKFVFKSDWTENNKFAARKIAKKLYKDWQKSAGKRADK